MFQILKSKGLIAMLTGLVALVAGIRVFRATGSFRAALVWGVGIFILATLTFPYIARNFLFFCAIGLLFLLWLQFT